MYRVWADWAQDETIHQEQIRQSLRYYLDAVNLNPENPDLRLDLAGAYLALGRQEEAFAQYRRAVDIGSPFHLGRAYAGLGNIYLLHGELDEATEAYRTAMQVGHDSQEALRWQLDATENRPDDLQARKSLALLYAAAHRKSDALEELDTALAIVSSDAERAEVEKLITLVEE